MPRIPKRIEGNHDQVVRKIAHQLKDQGWDVKTDLPNRKKPNPVGKDNRVGEQVITITETQVQRREKLETSLQKVQSRGGFTKFFVGPDYGEINNAKKLLAQNREQIKQLDEVQNQLTDKNDKQKLPEQVQLLAQTTQEIENSLNTSQKGFSLFGWLFRLFVR